MKAATLLFCTECSETQVATVLRLWLMSSLSCSLWRAALRSDCIKQCVIYRPLRNRSSKSLYDITFARRFLCGKQMTACEQIRLRAVVVHCFSDSGLRRIRCCTVLHGSEVMSFKCGLSSTKKSVLASINNSSSFEQVLLSTAWPRWISGQVLSSHSVVSSSRTVRPCGPWGGRWICHWRTKWPTVCSSAPHSQVAEETIPPLVQAERKRPTPVRKRLSRTQALLGRVIPGGGYRCLELKCGVLWGSPPTPHSIGDPPTASHVCCCCCCCQKNWWVVVRRVQMSVSIWGAVHLHLMDGWALGGADVHAPWHGVLETVWLHCDEAQQVECLRGLEGCPLA